MIATIAALQDWDGVFLFAYSHTNQPEKDKQSSFFDIEGNPASPINEGTLCPKGANTFQLHHNPHREKQVLWRAPYSDRRPANVDTRYSSPE